MLDQNHFCGGWGRWGWGGGGAWLISVMPPFWDQITVESEGVGAGGRRGSQEERKIKRPERMSELNEIVDKEWIQESPYHYNSPSLSKKVKTLT